MNNFTTKDNDSKKKPGLNFGVISLWVFIPVMVGCAFLADAYPEHALVIVGIPIVGFSLALGFFFGRAGTILSVSGLVFVAIFNAIDGSYPLWAGGCVILVLGGLTFLGEILRKNTRGETDVLIKNEADVFKKNENGKLPVDLASKNSKASEAIKKHMAEDNKKISKLKRSLQRDDQCYNIMNEFKALIGEVKFSKFLSKLETNNSYMYAWQELLWESYCASIKDNTTRSILIDLTPNEILMMAKRFHNYENTEE